MLRGQLRQYEERHGDLFVLSFPPAEPIRIAFRGADPDLVRERLGWAIKSLLENAISARPSTPIEVVVEPIDTEAVRLTIRNALTEERQRALEDLRQRARALASPPGDGVIWRDERGTVGIHAELSWPVGKIVAWLTPDEIDRMTIGELLQIRGLTSKQGDPSALYGGEGIGLGAAASTVQQMGGRFDVEASAPAFVVSMTLPRVTHRPDEGVRGEAHAFVGLGGLLEDVTPTELGVALLVVAAVVVLAAYLAWPALRAMGQPLKPWDAARSSGGAEIGNYEE